MRQLRNGPSIALLLLVLLSTDIIHFDGVVDSFSLPVERSIASHRRPIKRHSKRTAAATTTLETQESKFLRKDDDGRSNDIIETLCSYFGSNEGVEYQRKRGNIQLTAGSGKTYIAWKVMERLLQQKEVGTKIGLFVTPYLNLIDQALNNRDAHGIMAGGPTVLENEEDAANSYETMIVASRSSRNQEVHTTNVTEIVAFLDSTTHISRSSSAKIFVCTYNSLPRIGKALKLSSAANLDIDVAVFDEAHRMEGLLANDDTKESTFKFGLFDSNINIRNRLFMTGTPRNFSQSSTILQGVSLKTRKDGLRKIVPRYGPKEPSNPYNIVSFSDESLFGPCLAAKTYLQSVEENITLPITLFGVEMDVFQQYSEVLSDDSSMSPKDYYLPMAIKSAFQELPIKHAVSFHSNNQRARDFLAMASDLEQGEANITLFNVDHTLTPAQRMEILGLAREAPRSLISNCKLLSTGVDESAWDLVVIADPVQSDTDGKQMIGRVGRKAPGKERGYVLVPIPIHMDTQDVVYQSFINTFQHMVSLNPQLQQDVLMVIERSEELNRTLEQLEYTTDLQQAFIFPSTVPRDVQTKLMGEAIMEYNRTNILDRWNEMYALLVQYKEREGNCNVPNKHKEDDENLGLWVSTQRVKKNKGILGEEQETRLTSLGFVWDAGSQRWEDMFSLLVKYKEREGNCNLPKKHQEDGKSLGAWVSSQRTRKKEGTMDDEEEARLTCLGFVWDAGSQKWEDMFSLLVKYKEREGNCNVPFKHKEDGENLGLWVSTQRVRKKRETLGEEQETRLASLGFVWDTDSQKWEDKFSLLVQYKGREGNCNVPNKHKEDGKSLGLWVSKQRVRKKEGSLGEGQETRLASLGFMWDADSQQWEDMFSLLVQYKEREGHCNVPKRYKEDGENLGEWVSRQRGRKKKGILDSDLEARLTSLGVVWNTLAQQWEDKFSLLVQYKEREGNCNVPSKHKEDGENLGAWVSRQRIAKNKGILGEEQETRLTNLGVVLD